jgi:hypothetical protein
MEPVTHEQTAAELARDYVAGENATRRQIATTSEEQGILTALVVLALPGPLRPGFVLEMQAAVAEAR